MGAMFNEVGDMLIFAAVARAGSLTRAGTQLGLPKSTISRRLAALEERLDSRLLLRTTRKLVLTESGEAFLDRCQRLADDVDEALTFAGELGAEPRGTLRVTLVPDIELLLADAIASFACRYPRITLELDESARYVDLASERYDLALRAGALADSTLVARRLLTLESTIFASPDYLTRYPRPSSPAELSQHRFVILAGRTRMERVLLHGKGQSVEVELPHALVATTSGMQRALAITGAGAILYPTRFSEEDVRAGRLVPLLPEWKSAPATIWIVTPSRRLQPRKTVLFVEHLLATFST